MRKVLILFFLLLVTIVSFSQDIVINKDTTLTHDWHIVPTSRVIRFETGGCIHGKATIYGGVIQAAYSQCIFDTTITLYPFGIFNDNFSTNWYGANQYNYDNSGYIQKTINTIIQNSSKVFRMITPKGIYHIRKPLLCYFWYGSAYRAATLHWSGESGGIWDDGNGTVIKYDSTAGFALGLQVNKGTEIDHLTFTGQFKSRVMPNDSLYYNMPMDSFYDANGLCTSDYTGIKIDYDGTQNASGSTGCYFHDLNVGNFTIDYSVSPNGVTFNAECMNFERIRMGDAKIGFLTSQAQEKNNVIRGFYSWGSIHTLFVIGMYGKAQAGNYVIDGGNVAGRPIRFIYLYNSSWFPTYISNVYAESLGSIGAIISSPSIPLPTNFTNCVFDLVYPEQIGRIPVLYCSQPKTVFNDCVIRYYGESTSMWFSGTMPVFNNCTFDGVVSSK